MNIMQHDCVSTWTTQKLELSGKVTPSSVQWHIMLKGVTATVSKPYQIRMTVAR